MTIMIVLAIAANLPRFFWASDDVVDDEGCGDIGDNDDGNDDEDDDDDDDNDGGDVGDDDELSAGWQTHWDQFYLEYDCNQC